MLLIIDDLTPAQVKMFMDLAGMLIVSGDAEAAVLASIVSLPVPQIVVARLDASTDTEAA